MGIPDPVVNEEETDPIDLDDLTPKESPKAIFGDTPICRLLIFLKDRRQLASWGDIIRNVEPPEGYNFIHVADAMNRLMSFGALREPKTGMFWMSFDNPVWRELYQAMEELEKKQRDIMGLKRIIPYVDEGMHLIITEEGRQFLFNGEELTGEIENDWWPMRAND